MRQTSIAVLERQIKSRIAKLGQCKQFIVGSFVESKRRCGHKTCACNNGGAMHDAHIITKRENGKTKTIYIPVDMVKEVAGWADEYKKVKELIREIDELSEKVIVAAKERKKVAIRAKRAAKETK